MNCTVYVTVITHFLLYRKSRKAQIMIETSCEKHNIYRFLFYTVSHKHNNEGKRKGARTGLLYPCETGAAKIEWQVVVKGGLSLEEYRE